MTDYSILHVYTEQAGGLRFISRFYEGDINITGGGGGWVSVQRPQRNPDTSWRGPTDAYAMEIPLILDTLGQKEADVEGRCRTIEKMAGQLVGAYQQPPVLILDANGALQNDVYNFPPLRWIIPDPPVWGEQLRRRSDGKRVRQCVTIKFQLYTAYDSIARTNEHHVPSSHSVIAKAGDTYKKIAARELKQYGGIRWANRLAQLNGARDGASKPLKGQVILLPSTEQIKLWERTPRR